MTCRTILLAALLAVTATTAQAQGAAPSTIAPPPSPLLQPLAPGAPDIARFPSPTPAPTIETPLDISDLFRSEVSAVVGSGAARRVLLSHPEVYGRAGRSLRIGDVYQDGWKIVSLTPKAVGLARNGETRLVDLTLAGKAAISADAAASGRASQRTVVDMGNLGLVPQMIKPEEPSPGDADAQAGGSGPDPAAVAALIQALAVLGAQTQ